MLSGAAHARESHREVTMARRYNRDKLGRFASKGGGGGRATGSAAGAVPRASAGTRSGSPTMRTASRSTLSKEQRAMQIGNRVARTAKRADDAAMGRLSKAADKYFKNPTDANKAAWIKAGKERDATFKAYAKQQGGARKAAERKFGLVRRNGALVSR